MPQARNLDAAPAAQILPGDGFGVRRDLGRRSLRDDAAAMEFCSQSLKLLLLERVASGSAMGM